MEGGFVFIHQW